MSAPVRTAPRPGRGAAPRPVVCVIAHEHRDVALAEDVCAGRFTHCGLTLTLGTRPDWLGAELPDDVEWRIEWTKFAWGLDLAHAYAQRREPRFLEVWQDLVESYLGAVPTGSDAAEVAARRITHWIYAWQAFAAADGFPGLRASLEPALRLRIGEQARWIRDHLAEARNHRTLELYALFVVALALPDLDRDGALLDFSVRELGRNLLADYRPDGVHCEASTHYHAIALRSFVGVRANARLRGVALPEGLEDRLLRAADFLMHCTRPDGWIPALSDADGGDYADLFELAAGELDRPDLDYVATRGRRGRAPAATCVSYPDGGYHVQRSGWGEGPAALADERYLIFDCGPLGDGGHGHYDLLSVEIAARGGPVLVDPGRYTYAEGEPNLRHWFKGTAAHNTVCVDGADQTPYRRGRPKGAVAGGRLLARLHADGLDVLAGEATSPCYDAVHARTVAFVAGEYWVIADRLTGERPHHYDLRWHLSPDAWQATHITRGDDATVVRAPRVALIVEHGASVAVEPGWVAPAYGVKHRAPVVSAVQEGTTASFCTVVMPLGDDEPPPRVRVRRDGGVTTIEVEHVRSRRHDVVAFADEHADLRLGPLRTRAKAAWLRGAADGSVVGLATCAATHTSLAIDRAPSPSPPARGGLFGLAPDAAVPTRDLLLDDDAVARALRASAAAGRGLRIEACTRVRAKYRVGDSLRTVHRVRIDGVDRYLATRTMGPERAERAVTTAPPPASPEGLRPVFELPGLGAVAWLFPHDRKIAGLPALADPERLAALLGRAVAASELVAWTPESSAIVRCTDETGRTLAFAKAYADDDLERVCAAHAQIAMATTVRVPRILAVDDAARVVVLEALDGQPLLTVDPRRAYDGFAALGATLAALHEIPPPPCAPPLRRLDALRVQTAADVLARACPGVAASAHALAGDLAAAHDAADDAAHDVCLHGDAHAANALWRDGRVALLDLDDVARGPAAADLAWVLAGLLDRRVRGELDAATEARLGRSVLDGYASVRPAPGAASLGRVTAACVLARHAMPAVGRVRPRLIAALPEILTEARRLLR